MKATKYTKSGAIRKRYSNLVPSNYQFGGSWNSYGGTAGLSGGQSGSGTTGSGTWDWNNFVNGLFGLGDSFITSYWNKGSDVQAAANYQLYEESKKTTYILWAVIGLMVALGVVLLIRKTK